MKFRKLKKIVHNKAIILIVIVFSILLLAWLAKESYNLLGSIFMSHDLGEIVKTSEPVESNIYFNYASSTNSFSPLIIKEIDKASKSLEIAVYSFKSQSIKEAVYRAVDRGVKVTLIFDLHKKEINDVLWLDLPLAIKRLDLGSSSTTYSVLMHHKFALIDRGENNERLIFGSNNWTEIQDEYDQSFLFLTGSHWLVNSFGHEFDRLSFGESGIKKLDNKSYNPKDLELIAGKFKYTVLFGPGRHNEGINDSLYKLIKEAKNSIKIMIWDLTDRNLAAELINRASAGVRVIVIGDSFNIINKSSAFSYLNDEKKRLKLDNLEILMDASSTPLSINNNQPNNIINVVDPFLHYHMLMVDDSKILFGTNNWSKAGSYYNDESAILTDDVMIIEKFKSAFDYNYKNSTLVFNQGV
ncbi:MAG: phospholipase D-like domain-containing protein [Patescibacteria group bacterium]